jgi:uncharacterized protein YyaL (SSP411 family)
MLTNFTARLAVCIFAAAALASAASAEPVAWHDFSPAIFQQAKEENKFVLLDVGTQWCHWCHVMDAQTYADPKVQKLLADRFIAVRADADAQPDLGNRYEDYGWPATIVFNAAGGEIVKRQGYLPPAEMASILQAIIDDPTPGPSVRAPREIHYGDQNALSASVRDELLHRHLDTYDTDKGSWGHGQKFLDWNNVEWSMRQAMRGDAREEQMARRTLAAQLNLLDPAWGGVYQYSTDDDWQHPHFEKIMQMQSADLRIYSLAYAQWHDPTYLNAAESIHHFLTSFLLAPNGAFYTSQDADLVDGVHSADYFKLSDADRRARGIPRVDRHQFSRENGWAIRSLVVLYETTGDLAALAQAQKAAAWILRNRALDGGGFRHDASDAAGPFLGDTLAMGQAFLELYEATADRSFLVRAEAASDFITSHFLRDKEPGVITADVHVATPFPPAQEFDENVDAARWANLLSQYSGRTADKNLAATAMRYLATPDVALSMRVAVGGLLLADDETSRSALHIAIVGPKSSESAATLFKLAIAFPTSYKRVEWYDAAEGPLQSMDVTYPRFPHPAAFVCTGTTCSRPAFSSEDLTKRLNHKI